MCLCGVICMYVGGRYFSVCNERRFSVEGVKI